MIFVTVGEQLPFDRLVRTVDNWAFNSGKEEVFAQIGRSGWVPPHIAYKTFLSPEEFTEKILVADVVVAHAGMGTIITALNLRKPIIVMPRKAALGEARNDHQFGTAKRFMELQYVSVAFDESELEAHLNNLENIANSRRNIKESEPSKLIIKVLRNFIDEL